MKLVSLFVFICSSLFLSANNIVHRVLQWKSDTAFVDADFNDNNYIPNYGEVFSVKSPTAVEISNPIYLLVNDSSAKYFARLGSECKLQTTMSESRGEMLVSVVIVPFRRNAITGQIEKLLSFDLKLSDKTELKAVVSSVVEPLQSVLGKGGWVRIATAKSGVYKLSYTDLQNMGFSNPAHVRIYGNGDGMLPGNNSGQYKPDLYEVPLLIQDGGDGKLDKDEYVAFYAQSPDKWQYSATKNVYLPTFHQFTDSNYYFVTCSQEFGKRIVQAPKIESSPTEIVTTYTDYDGYDLNDTNLVRSGQLWFRSLGTSYKATFNCPNFVAGSQIQVIMNAAVQSSSELSITVAGDAQQVKFTAPHAWNSTSQYDAVAVLFASANTMRISGNTINLTASYSAFSINNRAWIDYIAVNAPSKLQFSGNQTLFHIPINAGVVADHIIENASNVVVWDVTDPNAVRALTTTLDGTKTHFTAIRDSSREYVAFNSSQFLTPSFIGRVPNQNLHSLSGIDMVIVVNDGLRSYAQELADMHLQNDGLTSIVVNQQQIFNEYSSGKPDPAAIRNFFRQLYKKEKDTNKTLQYALFFGDGSYDNRNLANFPNYLITYQSEESMAPGATYVSDDFFALLDDDEGEVSGNLSGVMDIGIGRITVDDASDARVVVDKIKRYHTDSTCKGNWQNMMTFLSDDADQDWEKSFTTEAEDISKLISDYNPDVNFDKVYMDAFKQESSAGGATYPDAAKALSERIAIGTLALNFFGHANPMRLASENILSSPDVLSWNNDKRLPLFITAGCQVGRYDDFSRKSLGETMLLHHGGGIALLTTTRYVENYSNIRLVSNLCEFLFNRQDGHALTLGQIVRLAKKITTGSNQNNFSLLGDPALRIALPHYKIVTDSVNHKPVAAGDTLSALETVTIRGHIETQNGKSLSDYNGYVFPVLYDKAQKQKTLSNDGQGAMLFSSQTGILFKGKAKIINGEFQYSFVMPKDISYSYGNGKLSYFATDYHTDAAGSTTVKVGGSCKEYTPDTIMPAVSVFMNDTFFKKGGITDQNPLLYVEVSDNTGINLSNSGIGHSATAVLDSNLSEVYVLNDFYESASNNGNKGIIRYPFYNLSDGEHTVDVKIWDVFNNSAQANTVFIVTSSAKFALIKVLAKPNPFTTSTAIAFEHNQQAQNLSVEITIFSMTGEIVKTIQSQFYADGFTDQNIAEWDGTNDNGDQIRPGLYLYKVEVKNADGEVANKVERVVYIR